MQKSFIKGEGIQGVNLNISICDGYNISTRFINPMQKVFDGKQLASEINGACREQVENTEDYKQADWSERNRMVREFRDARAKEHGYEGFGCIPTEFGFSEDDYKAIFNFFKKCVVSTDTSSNIFDAED